MSAHTDGPSPTTDPDRSAADDARDQDEGALPPDPSPADTGLLGGVDEANEDVDAFSEPDDD